MKLYKLGYQTARAHTRAHSHYFSPAETTITLSLHIKNPRSKHHIDDRYL